MGGISRKKLGISSGAENVGKKLGEFGGLQSNVGPAWAYVFFCQNRAKTQQLRGSYAMA
jgi:hypothetical protein